MELPIPTPDIRIDYDPSNGEFSAVRVSDETLLYRQIQNNVNGINQYGFLDGTVQFLDFSLPAGISPQANVYVGVRALKEFLASTLKVTWPFFTVPYTVTEVTVNGVNIILAPFVIPNDQPISVPLIEPPILIPENSTVGIVTDPPDLGLFITLQFNQ